MRFADALGDAVREPFETARRRLRPSTTSRLLTKPLVTGMLLALLVERGRGRARLNGRRNTFRVRRGRQARRHRPATAHAHVGSAGVAAALSLDGRRARTASWTLSPRSRSNVRRASASSTATSASSRSGCSRRRSRGVRLDELARREIFEPLKLTRTFFNPERSIADRGGRVRVGRERLRARDVRKRDAGEQRRCAWREQTIWGEVHDGNAYLPRRRGRVTPASSRTRARRCAWPRSFYRARSVCSNPRLACSSART